jgi:hypothetical protein
METVTITIYTTRFNILKFCILPTQCICVFHVVLTVNRDFSLNSINLLAFVAVLCFL